MNLQGSAPPEDPLAQLLVDCLEEFDAGGDVAVERFLARYPEHALDLRRRLEELRAVGLLAAPPGSAVPERLGPFRLVQQLGAGGMGVVYRAVQEPLQREVALKLVRPELVYFEGARERFRREVTAIAQLQHPGIVPVYLGGEEQGIPYYAMELVEGCSLEQVLRDLEGCDPATLTGRDFRRAVQAHARSGDEGEAALRDGRWVDVCFRIAVQVADALEHAHRRGVLHRDVKPSNVMVTASGRAMLVDFGLASTTGSERITRSGAHLGSLAYSAPEQVRGEQALGPRTDVYGLGVLLYELLALALPYRASTTEGTRRAILDGAPEPLPRRNRAVAWDAETVCLTAMDRDPERRYATAADLARDLRNVLERRPIEARRPGALLRARRFAERRPATAVGLVAALALFGGAVFYGFRQHQANVALQAANGEKERALADLSASNRKLDEALQVAEGRRREAERLREEAQQNAARAESHFQVALDAGVGMLTNVGSLVLRDVPLSEDVRRRLLEQADGLARTLRAAAPESERLRLLTAITLRKLGQFYEDVGEDSRSETAYLGCMALLDELRSANPDDGSVQLETSRATRDLGSFLTRSQRTGEARDVFLAGIAAGDEAREDLPEAALTAEFRLAHAALLEGLATVYWIEDALEDAAELYAEAGFLLEECESLVVPRDLGALVIANAANSAGALMELGRLDEARDAIEHAVEQSEALCRDAPGSAELLTIAGNVQFLRAMVLRCQGEEDAALDAGGRGRELLHGALRAFPDLVLARQRLASGLDNLGALLAEQQRFEELREVLEEHRGLVAGLEEDGAAVSPASSVVLAARTGLCLAGAGDGEGAGASFQEALRGIDALELDDAALDDEAIELVVDALLSHARFCWQEERRAEAQDLARRAAETAARHARSGYPWRQTCARLWITSALWSGAAGNTEEVSDSLARLDSLDLDPGDPVVGSLLEEVEGEAPAALRDSLHEVLRR